jgi:hypothetical protein
MAPRARIAMYKVLWGDGTGYTDAIISALEDALIDGVDVINYSLGPSTPEGLLNNMESEPSRLLVASGVFISAAGGNSGPSPSTVSNAFPWLMTVAAVVPLPAAARSYMPRLLRWPPSRLGVLSF